MNKFIFSGFFLSLPFFMAGQSHNYWSRSFNEESSLLSGAVVGGGSGPSAIYYNPASISEVVASKFSLNASLVSFDFINVRNALGTSLDLDAVIAKVEPRFISYMFNLKKHRNWSIEVAFLNNENEKGYFTSSVDEKINILTGSPGDERYYAYYQYNTYFRDDWIGFGVSVGLNERIIVGMSMFACIKTLNYTNAVEINAYPLQDSMQAPGKSNSFYAATYVDDRFLKFNDYRLLWKAGVLYKWKSLSAGLTVTTPSIGVYSDGKRVERKQAQSNISDPETGMPIPDYLLADYKETKDVDVSFKTPFSVAAGLTYNFLNQKRVLYLSMEYFSGIDPYRMVEADESQFLSQGNESAVYSDWLTYASGARPIFNVALGFSSALNEKLQIKVGFRTDFNYQKNLNFDEYSDDSRIQKTNLDLYYLTCGLSWRFLGQDIITGIQYATGRSLGQKQIVNLSDPVEYNFTEQRPLQGTRTNDVTSSLNSVILYIGLSLNFGGNKKP
jgi:hypothetical protein